MDEPTNDLDIETLELLEELLLEYPGTLLLVSHDRVFLNNVVTSTIALEGNGAVNEYAGGYDDWVSQRHPVAAAEQPVLKIKKTPVKKEKPIVARKLTFKEQQELDALPLKIEKLEEEQKVFYALFADLDFYQKSPEEIAKARARSEKLSAELDKINQRWEYLENLSAA
jgi:ATP-binding cassette subfamily F protein uup